MDQTDFEKFHDDLRSALMADIPLIGGKDHRLTVIELENLRQRLDAVIHDPQRSIDETNRTTWHDSSLPKWYRAALTVFAKTGSTLPVFEGLSVRPVASRDVSRALRWTFIYLLVVAATALLGLSIFEILVVPSIEYFREDLILPAAIEVTPRFDVLPWLPWIILALAFGLVLGLLGMMAGGRADLTTWFGRRFVCCAVSTTVLRISQSLVLAEMAVDDAVSNAFELVGAEPNVRRKVQTMIRGCDRAYAIGQMADSSLLTASNRLAHLRIVTPVLLTVMLGGGMVVIYCLIVFWPILTLLRELPSAGV